MSVVPRVMVIVGTAFLHLAHYMEMYPNAIFILVDVPVELDGLRLSNKQRSRCHALPLGCGLTVQQLSRMHFTQEQQAAIAKIPNINMRDGLAQVAGIGRAAVMHLLEQRDVKSIMDGLVDTLMTLAGGELETVLVSFYSGTSGGSGSQGGNAMFNHIIDTLIRKSSVNIHAEIHLLGGITFTDSGFPRTQLNAASAAVTWVQQSLYADRERLTTTFFLREVPAVGISRDRRTDFMLDQDQAFSSPAIAQFVDTIRTNQAANGPLGNMLIPRSDHYRRLPRETVATDVARAYIPEIEDLIDTPSDTSRVVRVFLDHESDIDRRSSEEELVSSCLDDGDVEHHLEWASEPIGVTARVNAELAGGFMMALSDGGENLAVSITDATSLERHIGLLRAIRDRMEDERATIFRERDNLAKIVDGQARRCKRCFKAVRHRARMGFAGRSFDAAVKAVRELREESQFLEETEAELLAIANVTSAIDRELDSLLGRLEQLLSQLDACASPNSPPNQQPFVSPQPLSDVLAELVAIAGHSSHGHVDIRDRLSRCIQYVTLEGLVAITGATSKSIDAIVDAVVEGNAITRGPSWGGKKRTDKCPRFIVYPAVDHELSVLLGQQHLRNPVHDLSIAFALPESRAVNVVGLEFRDALQIADVITPYLLDGISNAFADPLAPFFLSDPTVLTDLSIQVGSTGIQTNEVAH